MKNFASTVGAFAADENAVTAIEYALLASVFALALVMGGNILRTKLAAAFAYFAAQFPPL